MTQLTGDSQPGIARTENCGFLFRRFATPEHMLAHCIFRSRPISAEAQPTAVFCDRGAVWVICSCLSIVVFVSGRRADTGVNPGKDCSGIPQNLDFAAQRPAVGWNGTYPNAKDPSRAFYTIFTWMRRKDPRTARIW
ncbi:hypothetical protein FB451DRAFT_1171520 [Mycena latifolia]|nr:hypothetical protein FB451DRAFT_1171520 [Mycena latifolia]